MKSKFVLIVLVQLASAAGYCYTLQGLEEKSQAAARVIVASQAQPDQSIPESLLKSAKCVAVVPDVVRAGFIFGASFGQGVVSCRIAGGGWSDPAFFSLTGGSWGWQVGVESTDLLMVFVDPNAIHRVSQGNFTLGGDATVAAGPLGRDAQAGTDYQLKSQIYTYSHSRGLFAGLTLNGSVYAIEKDADAMVYGSSSTRQILSGDHVNSGVTSPYVTALRIHAR